MHPGFCSVCCDVFDQVDCVPCRITCGHVACQRCCDTLVESRQCCPFRCGLANLRPRDIRPMAMSLVTDSDSFNGGIVRSKVLATLSDIRAFQIQYNQNSLAVHSLREDISTQKESIQNYSRILHKVIQRRKDFFQSLARAHAEYEGEVSAQCQLREELTQLRGKLRATATTPPKTPSTASTSTGHKRHRIDDECSEEQDAFRCRKKGPPASVFK